MVGLCGASVLHYPTAMVMAGRCRELGRWRGGVLQHDLVPGVVRSWCCGDFIVGSEDLVVGPYGSRVVGVTPVLPSFS